MDKVVILFKGGVETQEYFSIEMSKTFQKHGYEIYWFDLVLSGLSAKQLCDFYKADKSKNSWRSHLILMVLQAKTGFMTNHLKAEASGMKRKSPFITWLLTIRCIIINICRCVRKIICR